MILVVLQHVASFGFSISESTENFHRYFTEFRMPLFFFVSGFVLYKSKDWTFGYIAKFLQKKIPVQILSPAIFMFLYFHFREIPILEGIFNEHKYGYWFTFVLFEYYIFYILIQLLCRVAHFKGLKKDCLIIFMGVFVYICNIIVTFPDYISGLIGFIHWKYFLFFCFGTLVRKHFICFIEQCEKKPFVLLCVMSYFLLNFYSNELQSFSHNLISLLLAISGIMLVFSFFRIYENCFYSDKKIGYILQYIGRRTLDIYLLHYFFIPRELPKVTSVFSTNSLPIIEFACSLIISLMVIAACLLISSVIRMSPTLAQWMFGVRKKQM